VFCYRTFCRFICPLGAIYGFFNRFGAGWPPKLSDPLLFGLAPEQRVSDLSA